MTSAPNGAEALSTSPVSMQDNAEGVKLLPCPFCGTTPDINNPATFQSSQGTKWGAVVCCCTGPEVRTGYDPVEEWRDDAIEAWNTRVSSPVPSVDVGGDGNRLPRGVASAAAYDVLAERRRQVEAEGWTPEHDDQHEGGEIALAAACYLTGRADLWPWSGSPKFKDLRTDLVRGVALGQAEIERLDRAALEGKANG
ncbi:Lar family restriction alleviation protein [Antarcticirhabdus aurantiaca]|uniref:Lar family restriction alleviation protein n=1 Tax=Antarcticirhabdus aurantiaca TaxID=2606717 RepID=A0ACD4NLD6_9HYPH|nr:Lar family restriction alleviation protein [Jeongeuplla avenae]